MSLGESDSLSPKMPGAIGDIALVSLRQSLHMGVFSLSILQTWSESAPYLAPLQAGKVRFLPSMTCQDTLCEPPGNGFNGDENAERGAAGHDDYLLEEDILERREHTRYGVRALVDFEWVDEGVLRRGQGLTRDISTKGMFIYSITKPPVKADLRVDVSFQESLDTHENPYEG